MRWAVDKRRCARLAAFSPTVVQQRRALGVGVVDAGAAGHDAAVVQRAPRARVGHRAADALRALLALREAAGVEVRVLQLVRAAQRGLAQQQTRSRRVPRRRAVVGALTHLNTAGREGGRGTAPLSVRATVRTDCDAAGVWPVCGAAVTWSARYCTDARRAHRRVADVRQSRGEGNSPRHGAALTMPLPNMYLHAQTTAAQTEGE